MFRKPLDPVDRAPDPAYVAGIASWQAGVCRTRPTRNTVTAPSPGVLQALAGELNGIKRGVLVIGRIDTPPERADVAPTGPQAQLAGLRRHHVRLASRR